MADSVAASLDLSIAAQDRGRAKLFAQALDGHFNWVESRRTWYAWDGDEERWQAGDQAIEALANDFLDDLAREAEKQNLVELLEGANGLGSRRAKLAMIAEAKSLPGVACESSDFDCDPFLLGVGNGVVDLRTGRLKQNRREYRVTLHTPVNYYPGEHKRAAPDSDWNYLLMTSIPDPSVRHFLKLYLGSVLTGSNHQEKFALLVGLGGTGKSTIINTAADALGPYAMPTNPDTFARQRAGAIREDLAAFEGKRLIHNMELPSGSQLDPTMIKSLSGGDVIRARRLHQNGRPIKPTWSCIVGCNSLPALQDAPDSGWWRRILVIPFYSRPPKIDYGLKERLRYQHEVVLDYLIQGSRLYYRDCKMNPEHVHQLPKAVRRECARYRVEYDPTGAWAESHLEPCPGSVVETADLTFSYVEWCNKMDVPKKMRLSATWLGRYLADQGYPSRKSNGKRYRIGVRMRTEEEIRRRNKRDSNPYRVALTDFESEVDL